MSSVSTTDKVMHFVNIVGVLLSIRRGVLIFLAHWLSMTRIVSPSFYPTILDTSGLYLSVLGTNTIQT